MVLRRAVRLQRRQPGARGAKFLIKVNRRIVSRHRTRKAAEIGFRKAFTRGKRLGFKSRIKR